MNILFFNPPGFNPSSGGTERVVEVLSRNFQEMGHAIYYVSVHNDSGYCPDEANTLVLDKVEDGSRHRVRIRAFADFVLANEVDLIIDNTHNNKFNHISIVKNVKILTGVKVVTLYHTSPNFYELEWSSLLNEQGKTSFPLYRKKSLPAFSVRLMAKVMRVITRRALRLRMSYVDKLILLSSSYIPEVMQQTGVLDENKYTAIPNICRFNSCDSKLQEKENIVLFVGRLCYVKRPDLAIEIWSKIEERFPDWKMVILGDGEWAEPLREWSKSKVERCYFAGNTNPLSYYQKAKVLLLTSVNEGFGLVLIEGKKHGVVPIAFNTFTALNEVIDYGCSGIAVEPYDIDDFVDKLSDLIEDSTQWKRLSDKAMQDKRYEKTQILSLWNKLFKELGLIS